jgi:RNA polymerase sigma-70 factor (ECF subfamily)
VFVPTNIFVRGVVRDALSDRPVPNAELRLPSRSTLSSEKSEQPNARTGPDGRFTLYVGWLSDQTPVTISAPGYQTLTTSFGPRPPQRNMLRDFHLQAAGAIPVEAKVPPVVVETFPVSGATDVDSELTVLRVRFGTTMQEGGWSWVKLDDETFPPTTGDPRFLPDKRTCVLPVKLQPGKLYAVWINYGSATNFQDIDGRAALPYLLIFQTRK